jgi:hypothetical protein
MNTNDKFERLQAEYDIAVNEYNQCLELMKEFYPDGDEYKWEFIESIDDAHESIEVLGCTFRASTILMEAAPVNFEIELQIFANDAFAKDNESSRSWRYLKEDLQDCERHMNALKNEMNLLNNLI